MKKSEIDELVERAASPQIAELEAALQRAHRTIDSIKHRNRQLREALERAAIDNLHLCKFNAVKKPRMKRAKKEEVAVAMLSDLQIGKVTPGFDIETCERRIAHLANRIARIVEIHRKGYPVKNLHAWLLGDMVEGELIFPGQPHQIEAGLYRQVLVDGPRILVNFLRTMLTIFERVNVRCVPGNHGAIGGRARKEVRPDTNADLFLYKHIEALFEQANEKRINFQIAPASEKEQGERPWYLVDKIGSYSCLLFHGDQIKAYATFPWYGFGKRVKGWSVIGHDERFPLEPFNDAACGHWHQDTKMTMGGIKVRVNGSVESYETHVLEQMAEMGIPSQHFMFVEPVKGRVTGEYEIDLSQA